MANFEDSIAHKAHGLVHGDRAKDYGHPRFDFSAIAKVWTGLCQDLLKEDAAFDPYRIAVMMSGLKLCRLVKSPGHHDSRVDTIGYMLTMERLDEPEDDWVERKGFPPGTFAARPCGDKCPEPPGTPCCEVDSQPRTNALTFSQVKVWFEAGEEKWINGQKHKNTDPCGKLIVFPFVDTADVTISPHPPANQTEVYVTGQSPDKMKWTDKDGPVKRVHNHEFQAPCIPPCPVWAAGRKIRPPQFEFTGEQVEIERHD